MISDSPVKLAVLNHNIACLRIDRFSDDLADKLTAVQNTLAGTNKIKLAGTILDLRFAGGENVAVEPVARFFEGQALPLAILVNAETSGAAAQLAAQLRAANAGIVIGGTNGPVPPDIAVTVSLNDEKQFQVNPYAVLSGNETAAALMTNDYVPFVDHTSEADLVRQKIKDGEQDENSAPAARPAPATPVIRDPALARAMDFMKALAFWHAARG